MSTEDTVVTSDYRVTLVIPPDNNAILFAACHLPLYQITYFHGLPPVCQGDEYYSCQSHTDCDQSKQQQRECQHSSGLPQPQSLASSCSWCALPSHQHEYLNQPSLTTFNRFCFHCSLPTPGEKITHSPFIQDFSSTRNGRSLHQFWFIIVTKSPTFILNLSG